MSASKRRKAVKSRKKGVPLRHKNRVGWSSDLTFAEDASAVAEIKSGFEEGILEAGDVEVWDVSCSSKSLEVVDQSGARNKLEVRALRHKRKAVAKELPASPRDMEKIIGRRIQVFWPLDRKWYKGLITAYKVPKGYQVIYDDGDKEWLFLSKEKYKLENLAVANMARFKAQGISQAPCQPNVNKQKRDVDIDSDSLLSAVALNDRPKGALQKGFCNESSYIDTSACFTNDSSNVVTAAIEGKRFARKRKESDIMEVTVDGLPKSLGSTDSTIERESVPFFNSSPQLRGGRTSETDRCQLSYVYVRRRNKIPNIQALSDVDRGETHKKEEKLCLESVDHDQMVLANDCKQNNTCILTAMNNADNAANMCEDLSRVLLHQNISQKRNSTGSLAAEVVLSGDCGNMNTFHNGVDQDNKFKKRKGLQDRNIVIGRYDFEMSKEDVVAHLLGDEFEMVWKKQIFARSGKFAEISDNEPMCKPKVEALTPNKLSGLTESPRGVYVGKDLFEGIATDAAAVEVMDHSFQDEYGAIFRALQPDIFLPLMMGMKQHMVSASMQNGSHLLITASHKEHTTPHGSWLSVKSDSQVQVPIVYTIIHKECAEAVTPRERDVSVCVPIQQFLLLQRTISFGLDVMTCICQAVDQAKLRLEPDSFLIYLNYFPLPGKWCMERVLFHGQMSARAASLAALDHSKEFVLIPSAFPWNELDLHMKAAFSTIKRCLTTSRSNLLHQTHCYLRTFMKFFEGSLSECVVLFSYFIASLVLQKSLLGCCEKSLFSKMGNLILPIRSRYNSNVLYIESKRHSMESIVRDSKKQLSKSGVDFVSNDGGPSKRGKTEADDEHMHQQTSGCIDLNCVGNLKEEEGCGHSHAWTMDRERSHVLCNRVMDTCLIVDPPNALCLEAKMTNIEQAAFGCCKQPNALQEANAEVMSIDPNVTSSSYYSRPLFPRKGKRKHKSTAVHMHSWWMDSRNASTHPWPQRNSPGKEDLTPSCCSANLLLTIGDRGWREIGAKVKLVSSGIDCLIGARSAEGKFYLHKVQGGPLINDANQYSRAMMWKGGYDWSLEFSERRQWNAFKHLYEECCHMNAGATSVKQIPIPGVRRIDESHDVDDFLGLPMHWSSNFISHREGEVEYALKQNCGFYDMESDDELFVKDFNRNHEGTYLTDEAFERVLFELEKITYLNQGEVIHVEEFTEQCHRLGSEAVVQEIYNHWRTKRCSKGTALVRHFQPPLWEQYQKKVESWKVKLSELKHTRRRREQLDTLCPPPRMFAFCLPPRDLHVSKSNRKFKKQWSQKRLRVALNSFQTSSSEESSTIYCSRSHAVDRDWYPSLPLRKPLESKYKPAAWSSQIHLKTEAAQAKAAEAWRYAAIKVARSHAQFLKFDSSLQRAVASLIELEASQSTVFFNTDDEQILMLKNRVEVLSSQHSSLLDRGSG